MSADAWLSTTLGKVAEFGNGGAWNQDEYTTDGIRVVRVSDVKGDTLDLSECKYLSMAALDRYGRHLLRTGDLIICTVGSHPTQPASVVGRAVVVPRFADGALLNQNAVRIRPAVPYVDAGWLGFLGRSRRFHEYIIGCAGGAASQVRMPIGLLKEMPIAVPPLLAQRRIASILSAYDDLIENNTRRIAILEEMARRIYEEWFVRFRFPGHEGVRMVESELGLVPEEWHLRRLDEAFIFGSGKPISKAGRETGVVPVYGANGIIGITALAPLSSRCVVLGKIGSCGAIHRPIEPCYVTNNAFFVEPRKGGSFEFMELTLRAVDYKPYIGGAANPYMPLPSFGHHLIVCPPFDIERRFSEVSAPVFALQATLRRQSANLRTTRDLLLPKLISGELDVSAMPEPETVAA